MRIGFDAKRAFFNSSGLGNYSRNLIESLTRYHPGNDYYLYTPREKGRISFNADVSCKLRSPERILHKIFRSSWRTKFISQIIKNDKLDIYHGLSGEIPVSLRKEKIKSAVTIHDMIYLRYPDLYNPIDRKIYFHKAQYACKNSDIVIAISEQTKTDIVNFTGINENRIKVVYQNCDQSFYETVSEEGRQALLKKINLPSNYLLNVGTIEKRKNLLTLVKAFHIIGEDIPLVVIGKKTDYYNKVADYISSNGIKNIIFPENISSCDLPAIYQMATAFVYPSVFEGFGIPIIEALVSRLPVITSIGGCFPEAGGPSTIYINPEDPYELSEAIRQISDNSSLRKKMAENGFGYARRFSAENISNDYIEAYRSVI